MQSHVIFVTNYMAGVVRNSQEADVDLDNVFIGQLRSGVKPLFYISSHHPGALVQWGECHILDDEDCFLQCLAKISHSDRLPASPRSSLLTPQQLGSIRGREVPWMNRS
ncbi:unnamed protein product [Caretta caretta]